MKFWNRNYTMVVIGQIVSLFANNILHFALTLYILDITGSGATYGFFTAISMVPTILFMPFGGVLADRVNKKKIMVSMDILTGFVVLTAAPLLSTSTPVRFIVPLLVVLSIIEAFYTPCVQASIPFLQEPDNLVKGNAIINQIASAANITGAVLGGVLYGITGIKPILIGSVVCFMASAVMEIFIVIPHVKPESSVTGIFNIVKADIKDAFRFIRIEQQNILRLIPSIAVLNFAVTSMLTVAVPFLTRITLGLSSSLYGLATGLISGAGVLGGFIAAMMSGKIKTKSLYKVLILIGLLIIPIGIGFWVSDNTMMLYALIIVCLMVAEICASIFSIFTVTAIELKTPSNLLGKVMSFIVTIGICAEPLGRGVYGVAFEIFKNDVWIVLLVTAIFVIAFSLPTKKPLRELGSE